MHNLVSFVEEYENKMSSSPSTSADKHQQQEMMLLRHESQMLYEQKQKILEY
jgi:hypothetical protein